MDTPAQDRGLSRGRAVDGVLFMDLI